MSAKALRNIVIAQTSRRNHDFFGINDITSKEIAGCYKESVLTKEERVKRYYALSVKRYLLESEEVSHKSSFGVVTFDHENVPKRHGQFDASNEELKFRSEDIKEMYERPNEREPKEETTIDVTSIPGYNPPYRISEVEPTHPLNAILSRFEEPTAQQLLERYSNQPPMVFHFGSHDELKTENPKKASAPESKPKVEKLSGRKLDLAAIDECIAEARPSKKLPLEFDEKKLYEVDEEVELEQEGTFNRIQTLEEKYEPQDSKQTYKSALDYLKKVRAGRIEPTAKGLKHRLETNNLTLKPEIKLDSRGFRVYKNQVPDWRKIRRTDLLEFLRRSIIYNNYDVLAFNKPYGIASHVDDQGEDVLNMNDLARELAASLNIEKVYLAHRLDKTTTGVLLFATSQERARSLNKLFKSDQVKKTYWCITKNVPEPRAGIIDIPIGEQAVGGIIRGMVAPEGFDERNQLARRYREARRAVTEYNVLAEKKAAALVEVKPRSGVKHQIRVHMAFGISCAILGDHKYSHLGKVAPQTLPTSMLSALRVRQPKVRTLPIHLHSKSVVIPGAKANGETLFINAPLPDFFIQNMKSLKLMDQYIKGLLD